MEKSQLSDYEQLRKQNIQRNTSFLREIAIYDTSQKTKETSVVVAKKRIFVEPQTAQRRSYRQRTIQAKKDNGLLRRLLVKTYPDNLNLCRQKKRLSLKHRHSNPNPQLWKVTHSKLSQRTKLSQQPSKEIHSKPKQQPISQTPKRRTKRKSKASLSLNRQRTLSPNVPPPILQPNQSNRRKSLKHLNSQVLVR